MKVVTAPDTIELTERQVLAALADAIKRETGREMDYITAVKEFDCTSIGEAGRKLLLNITVTLKAKDEA